MIDYEFLIYNNENYNKQITQICQLIYTFAPYNIYFFRINPKIIFQFI